MHAECKGHRRVTRSTYSAELQAGVDAADELFSLSLAMEEIVSGPQPASVTRAKWDVAAFSWSSVSGSGTGSGYEDCSAHGEEATQMVATRPVKKLFYTELVIDAMSFFKSVSAVVVREPAENSCSILLF